MTYDEYMDLMLAEIPDTYQKSVGFPIYDIVSACAMVAERLSNDLEAAKLLLDPDNLSGFELEEYVRDRTGLERVDGDFATGTVTLTGSGTVPVGTTFLASNGVSFYTMYEATISGSGDIDVTCNTMGSAGNVPAGAINTFARTLYGFTSVTNALPTTGGADEETDDELRARYYLRMRTPPTSGNIYAYQEWALETPGVGSVKVFPLGHGDGTVDVVITSDSGGVADASLITTVQNYIDPGSTGEGRGQAPIGAECYVSSATGVSVDIAATVIPDGTKTDQELDAILQAEITKIFAETFDSGKVSYGKIANAIYDAEGVEDFDELSLDEGYTEIELGARECAVIGNWSVTYEHD